MAVACKRCHWCARHVGAINLYANVGLFVVKLMGGVFGSSQALIADAIHSLSDVVVAVLLVVGLKVSAAPPDEDHHWGHGNIEFIVSAVIGVLLICAAVTLTVVSLASVLEGAAYHPGVLAVWAAAISVIANEILFRHSICIGQQLDSPAMIANAWENRADVYSSLAALIGVFGANMGFVFLDPVAAIIVSCMVARSGLRTLSLGVKGMTDRSFDGRMLAEVRKLALKTEGVEGVGRLRARKVGQKHWVDMEAQFHPGMKVADVKRVIARVKERVMEEFDGIADVAVVAQVAQPELEEA